MGGGDRQVTYQLTRKTFESADPKALGFLDTFVHLSTAQPAPRTQFTNFIRPCTLTDIPYLLLNIGL